MSKNTLLSELINYISANSSGNVVIAAPTSGFALDVTGTGRFTGALTLGSTITNGTFTYTLPGATGTLALTSSLGSYLPLAGGTLTGALGGTSATFSGAINLTGTANSFQVASIFRNANRVFFGGDTGGYFFQNSANSATVLQIADSGAATFSSTVTATGFEVGNGQFYRARRTSSNLLTDMIGIPSGTNDVRILTTGAFNVVSGALTTFLGITDTGAATFSSSVTAVGDYINGTIANNGTGRFRGTFTSVNTSASLAKVQFGGGEGSQFRAYMEVRQLWNGSSTDQDIGFTTFKGGVGSAEAMVIKSSGNVGIGTTSPTAKLDVRTGVAGTLVNFTDGVAQTFQVNTTSTGIDITNPNSGYISFSNTSERMRITSTGQMIVGDTSMTYGNNQGYVAGFKGASASQAFISIAKSGQSLSSQGFMIGLDNSLAYIFNHDNTPISFYINGGEKMRITSGGNVLVGTTSATASVFSFQVGNGTADTRGFFNPNNPYSIGLANGGSSAWYIGVNAQTAANGLQFYSNELGSAAMTIRTTGNVLIGTTADTGQKLVVSSGNTLESSAHLHLVNPNFSGYHWLDATAYWIGQNSNFRQLRMYSGSNIYSGVYLAAGGTSWTAYSDERMKTDLLPIEMAVDKVSKLRAVTGRYKTDDESKRRSFLIAQDVKEVLPEAVTENNDKIKSLGVQYTDIIPLLVASIKELKQEIDLLKQQ